MEACQFIGHFEIEEVHLETKTYHNLIFDNQEKIKIEAVSYETFIQDKPEEQDLKEYIAGRLKF